MKDIPWLPLSVLVTIVLAVLGLIGNWWRKKPRIRGLRNAPSWLVGRSIQFLFRGPEIVAIEEGPDMYRREGKRWVRMPDGGTYAVLDQARIGRGPATNLRNGVEYQIGFQFDANPKGKYKLIITTDKGTIRSKFDSWDITKQ